MTYIATAALVVIAWRFWVLADAVIEYMNTPRTNLNTHVIPQELIDLLTNFRRRRVKKETTNGL